MDHARINYLLHQQAGGLLTKEEWSELEALVNSSGHEGTFQEVFEQILKTTDPDLTVDTEKWRSVLAKIVTVDKSEIIQSATPAADQKSAASTVASEPYFHASAHRVHFLKTAWFRYAAIVLLLIGSGAYLWFRSNRPQMLTSDHQQVQTDVPPGKNGAVLTLADGRKLVLDSIGNGKIATQDGTEILLSNDQLVYDASAATGKVSNNTITTPKGRQFHILLPDGTKVWLNAASSIEYPVAFKGKERRVKISGELYFDVANKSWQPFIVETGNLKVEVLGTTFNISSYEDEKTVQTTLLTGAVKLTPLSGNRNTDVGGDKDRHKVLIPGQTAVLDITDMQAVPSLTITDTQDPGKITAWKDGLFNFDGVDLYSVMRQLERWYNIEVHYVGKPDNVIFKGKMYRNTNLSDLLKVLETMEVNFELKGNILYVR